MRCGSMLPDGDEGICPTCGTEFGRATIAMPALNKAEVLKNAAARRAKASPIDHALGADAPPPAEPGVGIPIAASQPATGQSRGLMVALVAIVVLIVVALGILGYILVTPDNAAETPMPPTPPPVEETIEPAG